MWGVEWMRNMEPSPDDMKDPSNWAIYSPESTDGKRKMNGFWWFLLGAAAVAIPAFAYFMWFFWQMTFRG